MSVSGKKMGKNGKNTSTIDINGHRYDARTGKALRTGTAGTGTQPAARPLTKADPIKPPAPPAKRSVARRPARSVTPHRPAPTHTLMRQAVKKPAASRKLFRAYGPTDKRSPSATSELIISQTVPILTVKRPTHVGRIPKSQLIKHFATGNAEFMPINPPLANRAEPAAVAVVKQPVAPPAAKPATTAELLQHALQQATSHEQAPPALPKRHSRGQHRATVAAMVALPLLLLGFVATQNRTGISLQLASASIGFSAKLPDYQPAGFSQGALDYSPGVVAAHFHSNSDDRAYSVTQKRSSWDSATLRDSFVAPRDPAYQTVSVSGHPVYLYNQSDATWVSGGIWYVIQSNGSLSQHQLLQLAGSL